MGGKGNTRAVALPAESLFPVEAQSFYQAAFDEDTLQHQYLPSIFA